jgi:uncharacterized membrane protein
MALLPASTLCDVIASSTGDPFWWQMAFWTLVAGEAAALAAATAGFVDYLAIPPERKASQVALRHMVAVGIAVTIFLFRLLIGPRSGGGAPADPTILLILSISGTLILLAGGWLGGTLVYRHGVGLEDRKAL